MKTTKKFLAVLLAVLLLASTMAVSFTASAADFKLTYDANGGINPPSSQTYLNSGEKNISTFRPTREGYTFLGWSTDPYAAVPEYQPGGKIMVDGLITLYAVWDLTPTASYMLIYNANGGVNPPANQTFASSGTQTVTTAGPAREGYTFMGWTTVPGNEVIEYFPGDSINVTGVIRLYAVWRYDEYANGDACFHAHVYEYNLWDTGADYFIDSMHEDLFEQQYGQTIQQYYAGCRFYYCSDCASLYADFGNGKLKYMKNNGEVFYLAGTGFFNDFPLFDTVEDYRLIPDQDSAALNDGDYWFDLDGFYANASPDYMPDRAAYAAHFEADDMVAMLSEDNRIVLLMHEHHYDQGGKYYGFWLFDLTDPANSNFNAPAYLHQHGEASSTFQQIPTADSDALAEGDYWFDLADFVYYMGLAGRYSEAELAEFEASTYAVNDDGTVLRVTFDGVSADYDSNSLVYMYLLKHGALAHDGFHEIPTEDSPALAEGEYWFDWAALAADSGMTPEQTAEELQYIKFYVNDDGSTLRVVQYGVRIKDVSAADDSEDLYAHLRQHNGFTILPTADSDALQNGDKWFDLADFLYYASVTNTYTEAELAAFETATYAIKDDGSVLRVTIDGVDADYNEYNFPFNFVQEHGVNLTEGFTEIPAADSDSLAEGAYWFDIAAYISDYNMNPEEVYEELQVTKFYVSGDGATLRVIQVGVRARDYTENSYPGSVNFYPYLRQHGNTDVFNPIPTADSDALLAGDKWFDLADFLLYARRVPDMYSAEEIAAFERATYSLNQAGTILRVTVDGVDTDYDENSLLILFVQEHGVDLTEGFTEIPTADSADLAEGAYWFDMATYVADSGLDPAQAAEDAQLTKFYVNNDGTVLRLIQLNIEAIDFTAANNPNEGGLNLYNYLRQHSVAAQPVELVDSASSVTVTATAGVLPADTVLVVVPDAPVANIEIGNGTLENYSHEAYDVSLTVNGTAVQPVGNVTVKLPIPAGYNKNSIVVYYVDGNGNKTDMHATVEGDYAVFTTDHFSTYVVVDASSAQTPEPTQPQNVCKWCGKVHEGFFQKIVGFFHRILAAIFGAKY